jgi:hypothetical protein
MKLYVWLNAIFVAVLFTVANSAEVPSGTQADDEGLITARVKGLDHVYARPGADLSRYDKIMLDAVEVSFDKTWRPDTPSQQITPADRQRIKDGLAKILREELARELAASGRYTLVDNAGDDVLRIKAEIRDLIINAPDVQSPGVTHSYTLSAGSMRLVAELRDAPTGALIARVIDYKRDPDAPWLQLTTRVDNIAAARRAAADWARILRRQLDAAHDIGKKS